MECTCATTFDRSSALLGEGYCPFLLWQLERIDLRLQRYVNHNRDSLNGHVLDHFLLNDKDAEFYSANPTGIPYWMRSLGEVAGHTILDLEDLGGKISCLVERFSLTPFETDILTLGMLTHFDSRYLALFSSLQRNSRKHHPTFELALNLFKLTSDQDTVLRGLLLPQSTLVKYQLIMVNTSKGNHEEGWGQSMFQTATGVYQYLIGNQYFSADLLASSRWFVPDQNIITPYPRSLLAALEILFHNNNRVLNPIIMLEGSSESGRLAAIRTIASKLNVCVLELNLAMLPEDTEEAKMTMCEALREVRMRGAVLVLRNLEHSEHNGISGIAMNYFFELLQQPGLRVIVICNKNSGHILIPGIPQLVVEMKILTLKEKEHLLQQTIDSEFAMDISISELCRKYSFNCETLPLILLEAKNYRNLRDVSDKVQASDLNMAFRFHSKKNFGCLAKRIEPRRTFDDLILAEEIKIQLYEILISAKHRSKMLDMGFSSKLGQYGTGISALFSGCSGTGKTMAAEVIAEALGVDLIKIDLSTVVNKYIGETEKNLSKIFDLAENDAGVLFFDEADALFGKRTAVSDSKDRHANIEVAYLLQRLENHPGLVIMATNNRNHIDDAFSRRFTFITSFSFPDATIREEIWRKAWPEQIKLSSEIDFSVLAKKAELTGANIRNIALLSSWLAADDNIDVNDKHISIAMERELKKVGRLTV